MRNRLRVLPWQPGEVLRYVDAARDGHGGYLSTLAGQTTLYATCYAVLLRHYLGSPAALEPATRDFILDCQDPSEGYFLGPEFRAWAPRPDAVHDAEHIRLHLACATIPVLQEFELAPRSCLAFALHFMDLPYLRSWLDQRDKSDWWLAGNDLLFAGQLLVYLRDEERQGNAQAALELYFDWLDQRVDPATGLWGTDGPCSRFVAMCGAYHQLLVYYHEGRPVRFRERLVDCVLGLQHADGGFSPQGGGGACEDVDAVDILVNMYKQLDYRRAAIRFALRRSLHHLLGLQNPDGGFPYKKGAPCVQMGIPATACPPGASGMFPTWFRVHTIALIAEILNDEPSLTGQRFRFSSALSMGWHRASDHALSPGADSRLAELPAAVWFHSVRAARSVRRLMRTLARRAH